MDFQHAVLLTLLFYTGLINLSGQEFADRPYTAWNIYYQHNLHHKLLLHQKYLGSRIVYCGNSNATLQLNILLSGDINPNPGPDRTENNWNGYPDSTIKYHREELHSLNNNYSLQSAPPLTQVLWNHIKDLGIARCSKPRGKRGGRRKGHHKLNQIIPNSSAPTSTEIVRITPEKLNFSNVPVYNSNNHVSITTKLCVLNAQSVCNKTAIINDHIIEHDFDIIAITETWLSNTDKHKKAIGELTLPGYEFFHVPRQIRSGGGVGIIHKESVTRGNCTQYNASSFESLCCDLTFKGHITPH